MGDLLGSFPESVQVRKKLAEKTRVGLWGQLVILKAVWGVIEYFDFYQSHTLISPNWINKRMKIMLIRLKCID
jgi:tellurite resistance-related uncharacterized protein